MKPAAPDFNSGEPGQGQAGVQQQARQGVRGGGPQGRSAERGDASAERRECIYIDIVMSGALNQDVITLIYSICYYFTTYTKFVNVELN